mmetsp:Transcript_13260/g.21650  ORF Transcript_13260/g.21650 Transcript_13260/m.21650 type:complete len:183 (-) Transcript_13260:231-779(-)
MENNSLHRMNNVPSRTTASTSKQPISNFGDRGRHYMLGKSIEVRRRLMVFDILDRQKSCNPDPMKPFTSFDDAFERLSAFQSFDTQLPTKEQEARFENDMDASTTTLIKEMANLEKALEEHLQKESKGSRLEDKLAIERATYDVATEKVQSFREERGEKLQPERLLCLVHGLDPNSILRRRK